VKRPTIPPWTARAASQSVQCTLSFPTWIDAVKSDVLKSFGPSDALEAVLDALDAVPDPSPPALSATAKAHISATSAPPEIDSNEVASEHSSFQEGRSLVLRAWQQ
jgi:hypothetical protein